MSFTYNSQHDCQETFAISSVSSSFSLGLSIVINCIFLLERYFQYYYQYYLCIISIIYVKFYKSKRPGFRE